MNSINDAAKEHSEKQPYGVWKDNAIDSFTKGAEFAEQKLLPLMIDYALWWKENVRYAEIPHHYCIKGQWTVCYKKEQVLEQYLKLKL